MTELEKLLAPFDEVTWIAISSTLAISFVLTQIICFTSRRVRHLCFGHKTGSPTMNLFEVFLCGGQDKVPKTSLARFIFWTLLIWSTLIRTCFQPISYRVLQLDNRHPPMKTTEDLMRNKFLRLQISAKDPLPVFDPENYDT